MFKADHVIQKQLSSLKQYDDVNILQNEIRKSYKNYMIGVIAFSFCMIVILGAFLYFGTKIYEKWTIVLAFALLNLISAQYQYSRFERLITFKFVQEHFHGNTKSHIE